MFGGGMRQAGIIAAAGLYALENNRCRLSEDHVRARDLALGLQDVEGLKVDLESVQTNMIYLHTESPASGFVEKAAALGIDFLALGPDLLRLVTHLHITDEDVEKTINAFNS
jgi:threonine aldolase